ncbi:MAG: alpha/beta hydrolase [Cyclobacteriaceae bacterium]|nr:alpha/beta hydrolase [Cyclobacteriaceae bacterium]
MKNKVPLPLRFVRWFFPRLEKLSARLAVNYFDRIFFTPLRYATPEKELECAAQSKMLVLSADNLRIQTYSWGDATPYVLVLHGWAGRATQFRKFIPKFLEAGYRVIGFDGPAHGRSAGKRTSIIEFETALKRVVQHFGPPQAAIAHSFGGGAALYAIMNGLPIATLVNIASPTIADEIIKSYLRAVNGSWKTGEAFKRLVLQKYGRVFDEFTAMYFIEHIKGLKLMLVHDADDRDVPIIQATKLKEKYPAAVLLQTTGLGHNRILKEEAVIDACLEFVRK